MQSTRMLALCRSSVCCRCLLLWLPSLTTGFYYNTDHCPLYLTYRLFNVEHLIITNDALRLRPLKLDFQYTQRNSIVKTNDIVLHSKKLKHSAVEVKRDKHILNEYSVYHASALLIGPYTNVYVSYC